MVGVGGDFGGLGQTAFPRMKRRGKVSVPDGFSVVLWPGTFRPLREKIPSGGRRTLCGVGGEFGGLGRTAFPRMRLAERCQSLTGFRWFCGPELFADYAKRFRLRDAVHCAGLVGNLAVWDGQPFRG